MKNAPFIKAGLFVFVVFAGLAPFFCHAENIFLGNVPEEVYLQKIPDRINLDINGKSYTLAKSDLTKWLNEKTDLKYSANYKSEIENPAYCLYKKSLICNLSFPFREQNNIRKISDLSFDQNALSDFVKNLAATSDQDPSDARLKMDNGKVSVFSLSSAGIKLDQEKSVAMIGKFQEIIPTKLRCLLKNLIRKSTPIP
jgi:vancomycin resistance protein YoaR